LHGVLAVVVGGGCQGPLLYRSARLSLVSDPDDLAAGHLGPDVSLRAVELLGDDGAA
jgi:hypothetical protein